MLQFILRHLFAEKFHGRRYVIGGLLPHEHDPRDLKYAQLGGIFGYTPRSRKKVLDTQSVKDQMMLNTCTWNAYTVQREIDEKCRLSVESIVCYGRISGLLSGNGYSTLRNVQKAGIDFGIAEETVLPNVLVDWDTYSSARKLNDQVKTNAALHKAKSYFQVSSKDEFLKAIDDGHVIDTGSDWYSSYNMSGGLRWPWVLPWKKGYLVGGHSYVIKGYNLDDKTYVCQNSFGRDWGNGGDFYVEMDDFHNDGLIGYVAVDLDGNNLPSVIGSYEGKQIKCAQTPVIYQVIGGKKRSFPDEMTFYAFGGRFIPDQTYLDVSQTIISQIPDGDPMSIEESPFWPLLKDNWQTIKWLKFPASYDKIDALISK